MLKLLFDSHFFIGVLIALAILAVVYLCVKHPNGKIVIFTVIAVALFGSAVYSANYIYSYNAAQNKTAGKLEIAENNKNNVNVTNGTITITDLEMLGTGNLHEYSATIITDDIFATNKNKVLAVSVNEGPVNYVYSHNSAVNVQYSRNFYKPDLSVDCNDTLDIKISLFPKFTQVILTTQGGPEAVKHWNYYFNNYEFKIKIELVDSVYFSETVANINDLKAVKLVSNGQSVSTTYMLTGGEYELPVLPDTQFQNFSYWHQENDTTPITVITATEDITLFAKFDYKYTFNINMWGLKKLLLNNGNYIVWNSGSITNLDNGTYLATANGEVFKILSKEQNTMTKAALLPNGNALALLYDNNTGWTKIYKYNDGDETYLYLCQQNMFLSNFVMLDNDDCLLYSDDSQFAMEITGKTGWMLYEAKKDGITTTQELSAGWTLRNLNVVHTFDNAAKVIAWTKPDSVYGWSFLIYYNPNTEEIKQVSIQGFTVDRVDATGKTLTVYDDVWVGSSTSGYQKTIEYKITSNGSVTIS